MPDDSPIDADPNVAAQAVARWLEAVVADRGLLTVLDADVRQRLLIAAGRVSRPDKTARRAQTRAWQRKDKVDKRDADRTLLNRTGIRELRENPLFLTPKRRIEHGEQPESAPASTPSPIGQISQERTCYVCRAPYAQVHFFYDQLCPTCGDFNHAKRTQVGDLRGRVALVTGARVKIGYQAAIMLLRSGCHVIVTTRFARDAARRYASEPDANEWRGRLEIHGIDLRHIPSVEALCDRLCSTHDRLDFIINNACQTVRRPPGFYGHLMDRELDDTLALSPPERALIADESGVLAMDRQGTLPAAALSQVPLAPGDDDSSELLFPTGTFDADQQQVDLRDVNSWRLKMADVPTVELLEVHLVNAVAPFVLNARLKPLMCKVPTADKHIVNVSAMEGQFYRTFKSDRHPHTNMAKASLNMMTRTAALDYIDDGIHMNSVDTGWVTDEDPMAHATHKREMHDFHPPLDIVDGAARIVDPVFSGLRTGQHVWGQFLKDYRITDW